TGINRAVLREVERGLRGRLRRSRPSRGDAVPSGRLQGVLPIVPGDVLRADSRRQRRFFADGPPRRRRLEPAPGQQPLSPPPARGLTTVIVLTLFMGGVQLLCLSIIGSYLAHIYDEVKRRPPYIVESVMNDPRRRDRITE